MTDQPALPPRRSLTAGRELPPRRGEAQGAAPVPAIRASQRPLPEERPRAGIEHRPVPARRPTPERRTPNRPDPRPMRVVYGAGAVAAMSIMAVGLVQPDWSSTADQAPTDDSYAPERDPNAVAALPDPTAGKAESAANVSVRHVIRYVYLKPGQTAPPGATVISSTAAPAGTTRTNPHNSGANAAATPRANNPGGGGSATTTPRPRATQAPAATPRPTPRPTPTTRQSGQH